MARVGKTNIERRRQVKPIKRTAFRRRSERVGSYHQLEERKLLAGMVHVDIAGTNLIIQGDALANEFSIDFSATSSERFVQGQNGTSIEFSSDFQSGVDLSQVLDIYILTEVGDDVVSIDGSGFLANDDMIIALGHGDDSLYMAGDSNGFMNIDDDLRIYGQSGHDSIFLSYINVGDDLAVYAAAGQDVLGLNCVEVDDNSELWGQFGHDTILINDSSFHDNFRVEFASGADRFQTSGSTYHRMGTINGVFGYDSVFVDTTNTLVSPFQLLSVEEMAAGPNVRGEAGRSVDQLKSEFFATSNSLDLELADQIQNGMDKLAGAFEIPLIQLDLEPASQRVTVNDPTPTVSVLWDQAAQEAVAQTGVGPTIGSRAYAMVHTAMFDAWSAYDSDAFSTQLGDSLQRPLVENTEANKTEAMSFAAYRVLDDLFGDRSAIFDDLMNQLGFDPNDTLMDSTPSGIGNRMASSLLSFRRHDGSNQLGTDANGTQGVPYSDTTGYTAFNPVGDPLDIERWTPERVPIDSNPGDEDRIQEFLTPQWGNVTPFGLTDGAQYRPAAPQPFLLVDGTVDLDAKTITLTDGTVEPISPSIVGTIINPAFIEQAEEVVQYSAELTDEQKLIAEFWEDGGGTSFPPGTFMTFGQFVSARDNHSIDQDAKLFFAMGNAVFDAGIATWEAKVHYDYVRPVRAIRDLGELGLIGQFDAGLGGYAIDAWVPTGGTQRILATEFLTYQTPGSDPSPPFAEYTSGHSAFSAAGAEILKLFTGSDTFGASVTFEPGDSRFEPGTTPSSSVTLNWETFSAAADEAGLSRLYGGIHFTEGDVNGRTLGSEVGQSVWDRVNFYVN